MAGVWQQARELYVRSGGVWIKIYGVEVELATLVEEANASDSLNAILTYAAAIVEVTSAIAAQNAQLFAVSTTTEGANAGDVVNAVVSYAAAIVEATTANTAPGAAAVYAIAIAETTSAASSQDATIIAFVAPFYGAIAIDGPIMPASPQPTVILIEG